MLGEVALTGSPGRPSLDQLRPGERHHVDGVVARPVEQVLDEVEEARVGPLHVLEGEYRRIHLCEPLEEEPPGGEQVLPVGGLRLGEPEQLREAWLDERALALVRQMLLQRLPELRAGGVLVVVFGDSAAHPHHVGQRPVRDPVPVGQAAAAMPVRELRQPVEVLVELPCEARLADARDARDRDEVCTALLGGGVEEVLDPAQLAVAADERRLETGRLECSARAGDDAQRLPERREPLFALELERACLGERDRLLGRAPRRLAHVHRSRFGR